MDGIWARFSALAVARLLRLPFLLAVSLVVAAGCAGSDSGAVPLPQEDAASPTTTVVSTSPTSEASTSSTVDPSVAAVGVWAELLELAADRGPGDTHNDSIAGLASPEVDEQMNGVFLSPGRQVISNAVSTVEGDVTTIEDCLFLLPGLTDSFTVWFSGTVEPGADGVFRVTEFNVESITGCVPAELGATILADYQTYRDSRDAYFNPPNPDAPELAATTTAEHQQNYKSLSQRFLDDGQVLRGDPEIHPEINRFRSPTEVLVIDCQLTDPDRGVYEAETGERTDLIPVIVAGRRDALEVTMLLEDGSWKVADVKAATDSGCEFAPTEFGIPHVPPSGDGP